MGGQSTGLMARVARGLIGKLGSKDRTDAALGRIGRLGLSERQQSLNFLWGVYRCMQYATRKLDWNGKENPDRVSTDVIATQGYLPAGFVDKGGQSLPIKFRKPTAPYALVRMIVDRFTGLLFSEGQHPEVHVEGDPKTEDWLRAVVTVTRLWQHMISGRTYGGAMGSTAVGFQFVNGKPIVEVHDPRWCVPEFVEHGSTVLRSIEKRYWYPKEEQDPTTGKWEVKHYWYRRIINEQNDTLFEPALVEEGDEPDWQVARQVTHGLGFCPVVWIQNIPLQESEDGDPDCPEAVYENTETIDALIAQANKGILANCDPTLVINSEAELGQISLGSDNTLKVPKGDAKFLEITAAGIKAAQELVVELRKHCLEMAACVLDAPEVAGKTATEVERLHQTMLAKADILREQYGQRGVIPLLEMMYRAAQQLNQPKAMPTVPAQPTPGAAQVGQLGAVQQAVDQLGGNPGGVTAPTPDAQQNQGVQAAPQPTIVRQQVILPPKYTKQPDGTMLREERELGEGGTITLRWPSYFQPNLQDVVQAVTAASTAMQGGILDDETAIGFVAPFFKAEDKQDLVQRVRANAAQQQADMMAQMAGGLPPDDGQLPQEPPPAGGAPGGVQG